MNIDTQRRRLLALGGTAALTSLAGCSGATPFVGKRIEDDQTVDADEVDELVVDTQKGDLTVRATDGDQIRIRTVKKAGSVFTDLDDVSVDVGNEDGRLSIETRTAADDSWLSGVPATDVTVELPSGVDLGELQSVTGSIDVRGVDSDATLSTVNGSLSVRNVDGVVSAETENGSVTARDVAGVENAETENASVEVDVPAISGDTVVASENGSVSAAVSTELDAEIVATTDRGQVDVDLSGFEAETRESTLVEGTLGDGGSELRFKTDNGSVELTELR